ncbi:hypothetical protein [Seleniivibrio sp.]|uniref:hypothetical protein n=1 Tax=Seleniivibrio sp. TaxID=2898801 RepID=UPI0025FDA5C4|nr:hypothetical protein [Seleniivibrio sp.]MCD8553899.1 hypothetical protein [Seleniivibrio sp.]
MEITKQTVPVTAQDAQGQEVTLQEGEETKVEVLKRLRSGGYLLAVKGRTVSAELDFEPSSKNFQAVATKGANGTTQFKFFPPLLEKAATTFTQPSDQQQNTFTKQPVQTQNQPQQNTTASQQTQTTIKPELTDLPQTKTIPQQTAPQQQAASQQTAQQSTQLRQETRHQIGTAIVKDVRVLPQKAETVIPQGDGQKQTAIQPAIRIATAIIENNTTTAIKLPPNSIPVADGEPMEVHVVKMLDNGKTLISVKDTLFEVKLDPQLFKTLIAEAKIQNDSVLLTFAKLPVENLNPQYVKQQVSGFDIEKFMQAFGKFTRVSMEDMTHQTLKDALKNSGLTFENKLLNDQDVGGDEKFRALLTGDNQAKDGITKMQITNLVIADGVMSFLKTKDENVGDTLCKIKKGADGSNTVYVSTSFTELGETLIVIKQVQNSYTVSIKTEKDISEYMDDIKLDNGTVRWLKFNKQDLQVMNPARELTADLGNFEVII